MADKDLISRQALLEAYDREHEGSPGMARRLIEEAESVDAVEVVRCRDCIYKSKEMNTCKNVQIRGEVAHIWIDPDGFCNCGEKTGIDSTNLKDEVCEACETTYYLEWEGEGKTIELKDTIQMMVSEDYKDRFKAEYWQTNIRFERLCSMIDQYEAGTLPFVPTCPIEILRQQRDGMAWYLIKLLDRANIEGICLYEPAPEEDKSCAFCEDAEDEEVCEACAITYSWEQGSANVLGETNDADK